MILLAELRLKGLLKRSLKNLGFTVIRSRSFPISILVGPNYQMNYEATPKQRDKFLEGSSFPYSFVQSWAWSIRLPDNLKGLSTV